MLLQSLVTHADPITTTMPTAGSVGVGMSTSKEVKARITSLDKQTYTPHGWGKEVLISWPVGGCLGEDRLGRGQREEERKQTWSTEARVVGKGERQACSERTGHGWKRKAERKLLG